MARKLFEGMTSSETELDSDIEYTPPEEELFEIELANKLLEHYISERDKANRRLVLHHPRDFQSEVHALESIIAGHNFHPQALIDTLTLRLVVESDGKNYHGNPIFTRTEYLTALVQALYNLDYGNEFVIDVRNWPEEYYWVGKYLKGKENKPLTLNLYGDVDCCGSYAGYCDFTIHDKVESCGLGARYCNFTFYDVIENCGHSATNSTFNLMPGAEVKKYLAIQPNHNIKRRMNEDGEWEIILPPSLVDECVSLIPLIKEKFRKILRHFTE